MIENVESLQYPSWMIVEEFDMKYQMDYCDVSNFRDDLSNSGVWRNVTTNLVVASLRLGLSQSN